MVPLSVCLLEQSGGKMKPACISGIDGTTMRNQMKGRNEEGEPLYYDRD